MVGSYKAYGKKWDEYSIVSVTISGNIEEISDFLNDWVVNA